MKKSSTLIVVLLLYLQPMMSQTKYDTIVNLVSNSTVIIDGQADEDCWARAEWKSIDQVWIPYGAAVPASDFEGRFKVSWDSEFLYMLVEIQDDSLSDDHADPLQNWWDDDCLEIFIDEDRSMGNHERNNNAFAYHVSLNYDAIDLNSSGGGINYKEHIDVVMDTIGEDLYLWELAFKIYDESYNHSNPEDSRIVLNHEKLMGLTVAYCDNDETTARENFIGSMSMPEANYNDSYKNADFFGVMLLVDSTKVSSISSKAISGISVYPNPAYSNIIIHTGREEDQLLRIYKLNGTILKELLFDGPVARIETEEIDPGCYILQVSGKSSISSQKIFVK